MLALILRFERTFSIRPGGEAHLRNLVFCEYGAPQSIFYFTSGITHLGFLQTNLPFHAFKNGTGLRKLVTGTLCLNYLDAFLITFVAKTEGVVGA